MNGPQLVELDDLTLGRLRRFRLLLFTGSDPVGHRLRVHSQQASDPPEAILLKIEPYGLLSHAGRVSVGLGSEHKAEPASVATVDLFALLCSAVADLPNTALAARADRRGGR